MIIYRRELSQVLDKLEGGVFVPNEARGGVEEEKLVQSHTRYIKMQVKFLTSVTGF